MRVRIKTLEALRNTPGIRGSEEAGFFTDIGFTTQMIRDLCGKTITITPTNNVNFYAGHLGRVDGDPAWIICDWMIEPKEDAFTELYLTLKC